jgi:phosphatidylserine/phosphatidylglycerophosphate/cardiolipin synthase-like enzyme
MHRTNFEGIIMRKTAKSTNGKLKINVVAGTCVVLIGIGLKKADAKNILGFAIHRTDHALGDEGKWLEGMKVFEQSEASAGELVSTRDFPVQGFLWQDFTARPGADYTYRVVALKGRPGALVEHASLHVECKVKTEAEIGKTHSVWFNRGIAGSQAYARKFGTATPTSVGSKAEKWLSRGLEEALLAFIASAKDKSFSLRGSFYEFSHAPVIDALALAAKRCKDMKLIIDMRVNAGGPHASNKANVAAAGLTAHVIPRTASPSAISHNKFLILLKNGKPVAVWTGSTNLTASGFFGQSNVGHLVKDAKVAKAYLAYWSLLAKDEENSALKPQVVALSPAPPIAMDAGAQCVFSPRASVAVLNAYRDVARGAKQAVFFTSAFGIGEEMGGAFDTENTVPSYILMESKGSAESTKARTDELLKVRSNQIAIGGGLPSDLTNGYMRWLKEIDKTGFSKHVHYVHDKFMLVDPLSADPRVITGSANFSLNSTTGNDENMLVIRGDKRVADIYTGEFVRLWRHYYFRDVMRRLGTKGAKKSWLATDDSWSADYYNPQSRKHFEQQVFAGSSF